MNPIEQRKQLLTRRSFLGLSSTCLGAAALNSLLNESAIGQKKPVHLYQGCLILHPRQSE